MITLTIQRISSNDKCTLGVLKDENNIPCFVTLELPWLDNKKNVSCIPKATYKCVLTNSPKHGLCYELKNVPDREDVQIHIGNYPKDTLGCILIGMRFGGDNSISSSSIAFDLFMKKMKGINEFNLRIVEEMK